MAPPNRQTSESLIQRLNDDPGAFDFFLALRVIECANPDKPRIGESAHSKDDPVRFHQEISLSFPPTTLARWIDRDNEPRTLTSYHLGLLGPTGPMPLFMTRYVSDRVRHHDHSTARFVNLFHHRMISLFYSVWASCQPTVGFDRPGEDSFGAKIDSFAGLAMPSQAKRQSLSDISRRFYFGRIASLAKNPSSIVAVISDYFGVTAQVDEFVGRWIELPPESICRIGHSRDSGLLGKNVIAGDRFYDCQQAFRVRIGPMSFGKYCQFLPYATGFRQLADWIRTIVGDEYGWEVQVVLDRKEVPPVSLGKSGNLGWTTWLSSKPLTRDPDDLIIQSN